MSKNDIYPGIFLIILCVVSYLETFNFPNISTEGDVGAAFWPRLLIYIILGLALILIVTSIINKRNNDNSEKEEGVSKENIFLKLLKPILGITIIVIFYFMFQDIGFFISTFLLYIFLALLMTEKITVKSFAVVLVQSIIIVTITYVLFNSFLRVGLPSGFLF